MIHTYQLPLVSRWRLEHTWSHNTSQTHRHTEKGGILLKSKNKKKKTHTKPLPDALDVVVGAAGRLAALRQAVQHHGLGAVEEEGEEGGDDLGFEGEGLILFAGEAWNLYQSWLWWECMGTRDASKGKAQHKLTINQKLPLPLRLHLVTHSILQQLDRNLHRHDQPVPYILLDQIPELAPGAVLLLPQQVPRGQVREAIVPHQVGALRALSRAGAAQHEDDGRLVGGVEGLVAFGEGVEGCCWRHFQWCVRGLGLFALGLLLLLLGLLLAPVL